MPFIDALQKIMPLSLPCIAALRASTQCKNYLKDRFLVCPEQINSHLYYIETGLVRVFYDTDTRTVTSYFGKEGDFVWSVQSFLKQEHSYESIQMLEKSEIWTISYHDLYKIRCTFPELNLHYSKILEQHLTTYDKRICLLHEEDHKKRYEMFLSLHPNVSHRLQVNHIAQYLNIRPETFSRVRSILKIKNL